MVDYAISCTGDGYTPVLLLCSVLVLVWPFGLPAFMLKLMWDAQEGIQNDDKAALQEFDFMIGDYKKTHWYWEIAELGRKLVLSGVLGLVGRGTVAQVMCATVVAFFYFAMVFHQRPYKSEALNMIKIVSEVQIFGVLIICCVLQTYDNDFSRETVSIDDWGIILTVLTMSIIPVAVLVVYMSATEAGGVSAALALLPRKEEGGASSTKTTNPRMNPMMAEAEKMDYNLD